MSAFLFGAQVSTKAAEGTDATTGDKLLGALTALIPAEAIAAFTLINTKFTDVTDAATAANPHATTTTVTDVFGARVACAAVTVLAIVAYIGGRVAKRPTGAHINAGKGSFVAKKDIPRALIPVAAFFVFLMWQYRVIFEAVTTWSLTEDRAELFGILLATFLGFIAFFVNYKVADS